jgi:WD40 repeat protein
MALEDEEPETLHGSGAGVILGERYQIREILGRGGMGEVYRAFDLKLRVDVALKSVRPELSASERARELLRQEVRSAREVVSPNVCRIFDLVVEEGRELVSMEYIDGVTLAETLQERGPLELKEAREVAAQFLSGLEAIHEAGLVHRDFKPENVMLTRAGRVVVMDFGLAKARSEGKSQTIAGTPAYMAPEQSRGEAVDARADVYSAGVVLAELLWSGRRPELWDAVRESPPRVPEGPWAPVLRQALSSERENRQPTARALARALDEVTHRLPGFEDRHPYPGLASFTQDDAEYFFGREMEVEGVWKKLKRPRLLALIGPSGAGKSSFLRAGLLPTLPPGWSVLISTPGNRPFQALAQALLPAFAGDMESIQAFLGFEKDTAVTLLSKWRRKSEHALVIVDQFEELFTLNPAEVQEGFATLLGRLVLEADIHVLLSLRDDFLFPCHKYEELSPILSELTLLGSLSPSALRRALVQPALACGYRFEDETLVEEMVSEVSRERGVLPLLAFAASRLWEKRDRERGLLTREAYQEIGGVGGALAQHAEQTLSRIGEARAPVVRELFRNLVTSQGTRASREVQDLLSIFPKADERKAAEEVLRELVAARLLTSYEDSVEIIHESLLFAWPRLVQWRNQDEGGALLRDQLRQAAQAWQDRGRPDDLLWTGKSFRELSLWRESYMGGLSAIEESFTQAATKLAGRKRRRRRIAGAALVASALAVASTTSLLWRRSETQALRAEASKLLALGELRLQEDPTEALAFATASLELADTEEARLFAMKATWEAPLAFELVAASQSTASLAFSPDGKWLATAGFTTDALVWHEDGTGPLVLPGHQPSPRGGSRALWGSADFLVTGSAGMTRAHVWFFPGGKRVRTIDFGGPTFWQAGASLLLAETVESESAQDPGVLLLRSWRLPDGDPLVLGRIDRRDVGTSWSYFAPDGRSWLYSKNQALFARPLPVGTGPDGIFAQLNGEPVDALPSANSLAVADQSGETRLWIFPPEGPVQEKVIPRPGTASFGMLPDRSGRWLSGKPGADRQVRLWDTTSWTESRPLGLRRNGSWYAAASAFHPIGEWVVASTAGATRVTFWPLSRRFPSVVDGYTTLTRPVAFSPDGKWLATNWEDRWIRLWPLPGSGRTEVRSLELPEEFRLRSLAFDPTGRYVFAVGGRDRAWVIPLDGSPARGLPKFSDDGQLNAAAVSPSGRFVATAFSYGRGDRTLRVFDLHSGTLSRFELPESPSAAGEGATGYERGISTLGFADESTLYSAGDGGVRRWNLETGSHELVAAASAGYGVRGAFSAENGVAITAEWLVGKAWDDCPRALLNDLESGTSRELTKFGPCGDWHRFAIALDPSGSIAAIGSADGMVRIGRLPDGEPHVLVGHKGPIDYIAISPDLRWVATTGEDNTLRLWPMPDLSKPPLLRLPHDELLAKLRSLTNLRVVRDPPSPKGWKVEVGTFPGWATLPEW